jgi:hypothetical protein
MGTGSCLFYVCCVALVGIFRGRNAAMFSRTICRKCRDMNMVLGDGKVENCARFEGTGFDEA